MRLKRAIIKHTDQIYNWQEGGGGGGGYIVMSANALPLSQKLQQTPRARLRWGGGRVWKGIFWGSVRSLVWGEVMVFVRVGGGGTLGLCLAGPIPLQPPLHPSSSTHPLETCFSTGPWHTGGMTLGISLCIEPKCAPPPPPEPPLPPPSTLLPAAPH